MGLAVFALFVLCGIYVQHRGVVQHEKLSRKLTDHSNLFGPINCLFYSFSKVPTSPYLDLENFPQLKILQNNWQVIRDEAIALNEQAQIKSSDKFDDIGFNSFFRTGWKRFYLKWYGSSLGSARQLCPKTVALLESIPTVKGAMFAMLPPGARLVKHRDPYAGSLRYHLGLVTPNSDNCYINVDGQRYSWRDGEAVIFDETFIHYAENTSEQNRIILFVDVRRPVAFFLVDWINRLFSRVVLGASATKNIDGDKIGFLNIIFSSIYKVRILGKKIKAYNRRLYYILQYGLYAWLIYLIFF